MDEDEIAPVPVIPVIFFGDELDQQWTGRLIVTTESGTTYFIDASRNRLQRVRGSEMPDDPEVGFPSRLRRDGDELVLLRIVHLELGQRAVFDLEPLGDPTQVSFTRRTTTYVTSIRELGSVPDEEEQ
ncbi:hypothetical protein ACFQ9V_13260 [Leifsonia sp. NPDC056665]|uniref:hypothetical protein n=1 Tax=Leifsonia sp. NPDC056665 TaxID=3345901 RepID=UPI0036A9F067